MDIIKNTRGPSTPFKTDLLAHKKFEYKKPILDAKTFKLFNEKKWQEIFEEYPNEKEIPIKKSAFEKIKSTALPKQSPENLLDSFSIESTDSE